ncbi:hypothetical protein LT85_2860 [Collimonas arenae]|uniref:Uncharacterized protein n=1 Tax=Collimonas arenae TaxID=279058 RepID=A0A0A1FB84_9BURK|nr:hypothetical protein LT85_2860 [Collimonas arenae]
MILRDLCWSNEPVMKIAGFFSPVFFVCMCMNISSDIQRQ